MLGDNGDPEVHPFYLYYEPEPCSSTLALGAAAGVCIYQRRAAALTSGSGSPNAPRTLVAPFPASPGVPSCQPRGGLPPSAILRAIPLACADSSPCRLFNRRHYAQRRCLGYWPLWRCSPSVGWQAAWPRQPPARGMLPVARWEYTTQKYLPVDVDALNQLGNDGWELVTIRKSEAARQFSSVASAGRSSRRSKFDRGEAPAACGYSIRPVMVSAASSWPMIQCNVVASTTASLGSLPNSLAAAASHIDGDIACSAEYSP